MLKKKKLQELQEKTQSENSVNEQPNFWLKLKRPY